jgi:hydrogenase maturation protease
MAAAGITVLGLGNLLLKDDGIGVYLVRELQKTGLPPAVRVCEIGTAVFEILLRAAGAAPLLVVDALHGGGRPGSVYRLDAGELRPRGGSGGQAISLHDFRLPELLALPGMAESGVGCRIFGVEPQEIDFGCSLTPALARKLPALVRALQDEIKRMLIT